MRKKASKFSDAQKALVLKQGAFPQFRGGSFGERDGPNPAGRDLAGLDSVGQRVLDPPGLAGARAGRNKGQPVIHLSPPPGQVPAGGRGQCAPASPITINWRTGRQGKPAASNRLTPSTKRSAPSAGMRRPRSGAQRWPVDHVAKGSAEDGDPRGKGDGRQGGDHGKQAGHQLFGRGDRAQDVQQVAFRLGHCGGGGLFAAVDGFTP